MQCINTMTTQKNAETAKKQFTRQHSNAMKLTELTDCLKNQSNILTCFQQKKKKKKFKAAAAEAHWKQSPLN